MGLQGATARLSHRSWRKHKCPLKIQRWDTELTGCGLKSNFILGSDESGEEILYLSQKISAHEPQSFTLLLPRSIITLKNGIRQNR